MKRSRAKRTALVTLAAMFLAVAGVWDAFVAIGRRLAGFVPWERFKQAFAVLIDRLPAPLVLLIFLVPFLIVEPLLVVATVAIAMGYVVSGALAWIALKLLAVGLLPAIFDLTKHKLMTMPWFVRVYDKVAGVSSLRRSAGRALQGSRRGSAAKMAAQGGRGDEAGSRTGSACRALCCPQAGRERQAADGLEGVKRSLRQLHPCAMAGCAGETAVASERAARRGLRRARHRWRHRPTNWRATPTARQEDFVRIAPERKIGEIFERLAASFRAHIAGQSVAAKHMGDLNVDEMRRMERFVRAE